MLAAYEGLPSPLSPYIQEIYRYHVRPVFTDFTPPLRHHRYGRYIIPTLEQTTYLGIYPPPSITTTIIINNNNNNININSKDNNTIITITNHIAHSQTW